MNLTRKQNRDKLLILTDKKLRTVKRYSRGWRGVYSETEMILMLSRLEQAFDYEFTFSVDDKGDLNAQRSGTK